MKFLGILRVFALSILAIGFRGPRGIFCSNFQGKHSNEAFIGSASEIFWNLEDSSRKAKVVEDQASKPGFVFQSSSWHNSYLASAVLFLEEFCMGVQAKKFTGILFEDLYDGLKEPCSRVSYYTKSYIDHIEPRNLLYGPYKDALKPEMFQHYVEWLVENIPGISESLEHLSNEFKGLSEKILKNDASVAPTIYGFEFHDVWTDKDFISSLRHKTSNLVNALKSLHGSLGKIHSDSFRNPLTEAQSGLVFENSKWDDSMLASTFLFLEEFCQEVKAEKFKGKLSDKKFKDLSGKCANLSSYMGSFIHRFKPTYGPGTVTERKEIPMNFYKDVLKAEDFKLYAKWIVKNTFKIRDSLIGMLLESLDMSETQLKTETSVGPLKYGFVFHCDGHHDKVKFAFKHATKRLTLSLQLLQNCLGEKPTEVKIEKVLRQLEGKRKAKHEKLMKEIAEQRTELVERLSKPDAPYSLKDMEPFLGVL